MVATITKLPFYTKQIPVLVEGQNFSSIRYMDPITEILYHDYTIAACNPLYPNAVKLEDGSFQQYGETLKNWNRKIYQWSMNSNLNVSNENLNCSLFAISDLKQIQIAQKICHNSKGKHSGIRIENTVMKIGNDQYQQENVLANEITVFRNLKTKSLYIWLNMNEIAVSVLTVYLIFCFVKNFPKLIIYLGLVFNGASWQQLLRNRQEPACNTM